ncbi:hypothetical protein ACHAXA_011680 [Cyclostephanos tholiformis]|uniref:SEC63 domain-containing protein n=1 Tax=Cyclostephanos tholiformis TaxID=382380 RepID=A0ABD3SEJ6_9STRA
MDDEAAAKPYSPQNLLHGIFLVILLIALVAQYFSLPDPKSTKKKGDGTKDKKIDNKVHLNPAADAAYLVNRLRPDSTPLQILYAIATSPDTIAVTSKHVDMAADLREKKRAHLAEREREGSSHKSMEDLFDDDGWAEDDANDSAAEAARRAREEKEKEAKRLAKATGKDVTDFSKMMLEGVDDGVLGQEWVVRNLTELGAWPPPSLDGSIVGADKFDLDGRMVAPLDHPGVRRALVMTMGRLRAKELNTHPELMAAGPKGLIDPTYFQATMEYRQRVGQVLEGALKMACTLRSYRLARSVLDAIVMFKIGLVDVKGKEHNKWFSEMMTRQYGPGGTPKLVIHEKFLGVPTPESEKEDDGEDSKDASEAARKEAARKKIVQQIMQTKQVTTTDDKMALEMHITRQHAESFTKEKLAMCQKQGIPPQMALQAYREAWFILVRARRVNDDGTPSLTWDGALGDAKYPGSMHFELLKEKKDPLYEMLDRDTLTSFTEELANPTSSCENRIVIGWPFVITNVAQKTGKVKIHLPPPVEPGRYEFIVSIVSQEFLGVGEEFSLFVDVAQGTEVKKEKTEEKENSESKKDK